MTAQSASEVEQRFQRIVVATSTVVDVDEVDVDEVARSDVSFVELVDEHATIIRTDVTVARSRRVVIESQGRGK